MLESRDILLISTALLITSVWGASKTCNVSSEIWFNRILESEFVMNYVYFAFSTFNIALLLYCKTVTVTFKTHCIPLLGQIFVGN